MSRRGWCLGDKAFRKELLAQVEEQAREFHYGEEMRESAEEKAERIVGMELKKLKWTEKDLEKRKKGDEKKVRIAGRLRRETVVTMAWIAQRLRMGARGHLTHLLYWNKRK